MPRGACCKWFSSQLRIFLEGKRYWGEVLSKPALAHNLTRVKLSLQGEEEVEDFWEGDRRPFQDGCYTMCSLHVFCTLAVVAKPPWDESGNQDHHLFKKTLALYRFLKKRATSVQSITFRCNYTTSLQTAGLQFLILTHIVRLLFLYRSMLEL